MEEERSGRIGRSGGMLMLGQNKLQRGSHGQQQTHWFTTSFLEGRVPESETWNVDQQLACFGSRWGVGGGVGGLGGGRRGKEGQLGRSERIQLAK